MDTVTLLHGGLWEDLDAHRFWHVPGVVAALRASGLAVHAPDRPRRPPTWEAEVAHLLPDLPRSVLVAGSNGVTPAVRLALAAPSLVTRLVLAWPATAHDPRVDARSAAPASLLAGGVLRGVADEELAALTMPVAVLPAPDNPAHQRRTADALLRLVPGAVELPSTPEPPRPDFSAAAFVAALAGFLA
ncbi:alpha/beta hydrolase [Actinosynnema sp. NPDC020468]|uniref:alpha/beta fold hydrolase n=1 Tax=Actinosynnema sp. NPDC020468 TaxID=3154488 RepID=UPI0033DE0685